MKESERVKETYTVVLALSQHSSILRFGLFFSFRYHGGLFQAEGTLLISQSGRNDWTKIVLVFAARI